MSFLPKKKGGAGSKKVRQKPMATVKRADQQRARPKHPGQQPKRGTKASKKRKEGK